MALFSWAPYLFLVLTISNIYYLSLISLAPNLIQNTWAIVGAHLLLLVPAHLTIRNFRHYLSLKMVEVKRLPLLLPALVIILLRFPMIYPTIDDLAVHMIYGDLANTLWHSANFVPLDFLTYFYLVLDLNYTPFLYTIGIRLTILLFDLVGLIWLFSVISRLRELLKTDLQRLLLDVLCLLIPFIPHVMATLGTLMIDFITIPIGLEALYLFLHRGRDKTFAALLTIILVLAKLSPSAFVILPLTYFAIKERKRIAWNTIILFGLVASWYFVRQYIETGSPMFGLYNGIFKSPLYPLSNFIQPLFGPETNLQLISWPIIGQFSERYAEGVVSGFAKVFFAPIPIIGYILSFWLLISRRSILYGLLFVSYLIWGKLAGYARYYELLNIITLVLMIMDLGRVNFFRRISSKLQLAILTIVAILGFSSMKTDLSWRPYPSIATAGVNAYVKGKYLEGLSYVGRDTIPLLARHYQPLFAGYDAVVTAYRGASTFIAYMGYRQGLPMINGVSDKQYENILTSPKVSRGLVKNLTRLKQTQRVLLVADENYNIVIPSLWISKNFTCEPIGNGDKLPHFQRDYYFGYVHLYTCTKN